MDTYTGLRLAVVLGVGALAVACEGATDQGSGSTDSTAPKRTASPVGETFLGGELVAFPSGDLTIAGELVLPERHGPFPGLLFFSGSGSQRRDGYAGQLDVRSGEFLTAISAQAGIAVLSFDDRGAGETPIGVTDPATLGYDTIVGDARAAYDYLIGRSDIDSSKIYLMGHSEGALTALILATSQKPSPVGVILMSAPGRPQVEISIDQAIWVLGPDATQEQKDNVAARQRAVLQAMIDDQIEDFEAPEAEKAVMRAQAPWLREVSSYDPAELISDTEVPLLILQGGKDFQVSAVKDGARLEETLARTRGPDSTYILLADADHLMWLEEGTSSVGRYLAPGREFHPEFLPAVLTWLVEQLAV